MPEVDQTGLFDGSSSSESSDNEPIQKKKQQPTATTTSALFDGDDDSSSSSSAEDDGTVNEIKEKETVYRDRVVHVPAVDRPGAGASDQFKVLVANLPSTIDVIQTPFAEDQYNENEEKEYLQSRGKRFAANSLVRFQVDDRTGEVKSNTRLVEYSDGSRVLFVGKEPFHATMPPATKNSFVALSRKVTFDDGNAYVEKMNYRACMCSHTHCQSK